MCVGDWHAHAIFTRLSLAFAPPPNFESGDEASLADDTENKIVPIHCIEAAGECDHVVILDLYLSYIPQDLPSDSRLYVKGTHYQDKPLVLSYSIGNQVMVKDMCSEVIIEGNYTTAESHDYANTMLNPT